ncbi:penicillin acylase family protein [Caldovatus aquaticus]|uniref:Penicillin acylase family protein n=1 Tax=Caldovatus aquaticus TaxID=2865671 RepID=A0ABS7F4G1_9PROT|nr:penicillin acylase family protein [Caldovatus aquaticus]MBW8270507.1 penicillin acylase family protein [Caldovatus aquaticus]
MRRRTAGRPPRRGPRRALLGLAGLLALLPLGGAGLVGWALPPAQEVVRLGHGAAGGLAAPVSVAFSREGVPLIRAESERDAWVAMGWLHARDRLFQMDLMRRTAAGRLSEWAGAVTLRSDRFVRLLGLARRAEEDLAALPAEVRDVLEAYAAGVNAWIAARGRFAAPEYLLLGPPEPWRPSDSLLWGKLMGLYLSGNWRVEVNRARLLAAGLPAERLRDLWPEDASAGRPDQPAPGAGEARVPAAAPPAAAAALDGGHLARLAAALPAFPADAPLPASASNVWAVAGPRSASGGALLANDPHLGFAAPVQWYLVRIALPGGRFLAGATSPGVPLVVIGRNERLAWGFTTTHADTQDVFVERLVPGRPDEYETPEGPRPFLVREERIAVRGAAQPVVMRVRETRHGPVLSDLDPPQGGGAASGRGDGTVLAVAMAGLAPGDTAAAGLLALNRARGVEEAGRAAALITAPSQNLVVADAEGRIALYLTGRIPRRRSGDGTLPAPGWDGTADWEGFVPFAALPHVVDPPGGVLVNANNRVAPAAAGAAFLGRDWFGDWRFRRIFALLARAAATGRLDAAEFAAMQTDAVSLFAREDALPALRRLVARPDLEGAAGAAYALLLGEGDGGWEGRMDPDRPEPLIFHAWLSALGRAALAAGGVPEGAWAPTAPEFLRFLLRAAAGAEAGDAQAAAAAAPWCGAQGCRALARRALEEAVAALAARYGPDPARWRWGEAHVARFEHPLLRFLPGLGPLVRLAAPTPGDGETVNRGTLQGGAGPEAFLHVQGAGLRVVFDLADRETRAIVATGQSGHPLSRHWGDLLERWRSGALLRLAAPAADAGAEGGGAAARITLTP